MSDTNLEPASPPPEDSLSGPPYEIGGELARGAFGVILTARDLRVQRSLVIKTPIAGKDASPRGVRRFVQEARILARLEHPNIVPVHSVGVDSDGVPFYTMKQVEGVTLGEILADLRDQQPLTLARYPLTKLLLVFGQICDAVGFAHSQGIIHRDLKPANVMLGEYGEVLVMDWGLAKILHQPDDETAEEAAASPVAGPMGTLDGTLVGTPAYMAPEQAAGRVSELDERTDIYALGAILYQILTLRPPVMAGSSLEALAEAQEGNIAPALFYNTHTEGPQPGTWLKRAGDLPHCPGGRIPAALAAVAMKAVSADPADRYQTVPELQADIAAYIGGFATGAEGAGLWQQIKLTIKRRKVEFAIAAAAIVLAHVAGGVFLWKFIQQERQARAALALAEGALREVQRNIPLMRNEALALINAGKFAEALPRLSYLSTLTPDSAEFPVLEGNTLQSLGRFAEAKVAYRRALRREAGHALAKENLALCDTLIAATGTNATLPAEALQLFHTALAKQGRTAGAASIAPELQAAQGAKLVEWRARLKAEGLTDKQVATLKMDAEGKLELDLNYSTLTKLPSFAGMPLKKLLAGVSKFTDLTPLIGLPLEHLNLGGTEGVNDLRPLKGMPLKHLDANHTAVTDLRPLAGIPLEELNLGGAPVQDLAPLKNAKLHTLRLRETKVSDLRPIQGQPLKLLAVAHSSVTDLSPLKGMKLETLEADNTKINDLGPLAGMPLRVLTLGATAVTSLAPLQGAPLDSLKMPGTLVTDLTPLKGAPLRELDVTRTAVTSLEGLQGMPLRRLDLKETKVADLTPLKGMMTLRTLHMEPSLVSDLSPLRGIPLQQLLVRDKVSDLSPLRGMPLERLVARCRGITNLAPLQGMPLKSLSLGQAKFSDITPLRGMPLEDLSLENGLVSDLSPLKGMRLRSIHLGGTPVAILEVLRGMPLTNIYMRNTRVVDLRPLQGMRLTIFSAPNTPVSDITPLKGMPLMELSLAGSKVRDVAPLVEFRDLERLSIPRGARNIEALRGLKKLTRLTYDTMPFPKKWTDVTTAEQFWAKYDEETKGAPKQ